MHTCLIVLNACTTWGTAAEPIGCNVCAESAFIGQAKYTSEPYVHTFVSLTDDEVTQKTLLAHVFHI